MSDRLREELVVACKNGDVRAVNELIAKLGDVSWKVEVRLYVLKCVFFGVVTNAGSW